MHCNNSKSEAMARRRASLAAILTAFTAAFTTPRTRRTPVIALRAKTSTAVELATLKKGDKLLGRLASPVFEGARGVKCFVDVRAVRTSNGRRADPAKVAAFTLCAPCPLIFLMTAVLAFSSPILVLRVFSRVSSYLA